MSVAWPSNFPKVVSSTPTKAVMRHPCFEAAKRHGDIEAANRLVADLVDLPLIERMAARHAGSRLVCVGGIEAANQIPVAYARLLSKHTGLPLDLGILKTNSPKHTGKAAMARFLSRAEFDGQIFRGANYIALDDVMTQGGTISELRQFLNKQGSRVVGVTTLAFTDSSVMGDGLQLSPTLETRRKLVAKHGLSQVGAALKDFGVYDGEVFAMTESEMCFVTRFEDLTLFRAEAVHCLAEMEAAARGSRAVGALPAEKATVRPSVRSA